MGAYIYRNEVSRIVELDNENQIEKKKEIFTSVICLAACALGVIGLLFRTGMF